VCAVCLTLLSLLFPSILTAMVGPTGAVIGCDRDARRLETLTAAAGRARAASIIRPIHADFLSLDPEKDASLAKVHAILLDPSCSGSGTDAVRGDWLSSAAGKDGSGEDSARLERLATFQEAALTHALSAFPSATRVTYSTCSVHVRENEAVVAAVMGGPGGRLGGWALETALPAWHRRGLAGSAPGLTDDEAACLVRVDSVEDETDGFFVALFVREVDK
jgi:putative methyltransferase